jgi:hypothetical protein
MAWSWLQSASTAPFATATSISAAYNTGLSPGTKLIACIVYTYTVTGSVSSVNDAAGNAFTSLASITNGTTLAAVYAIDTPAGDAGTAPVITAAFSATGIAGLLIQEVSGLAGGATLALMADGTPGVLTGTGGSPIASPAYSSTVPGEYLLSFVATAAGNTWTAPGNLTADPANVGGDLHGDLAAGYANSAGGSESAAWTQTSGGDLWCSVLFAFKLAAPAASGLGSPFYLPAGSRG